MKKHQADILTYDFTRLAHAMLQCDCAINLSHNPHLPGLIGKTMNWPVVSVLFHVSDIPVAWFSAVNTGREWFSLPHFNNGAFWIDLKTIQLWLSDQQMCAAPDEKMFFEMLINRKHWFSSWVASNLFWIVSLEPSDFVPSGVTCEGKLYLSHRSYFPVSRFFSGHKTDSLLQLMEAPEQQMQHFSPDVRRKIRKAVKNGIHVSTGGVELLDDFYCVYRRNIHALCSMGLPESFFRSLVENYAGGKISIMVAFFNNEPVGAAVLMTWLNFAENPWFATLRQFNKLYVGYLLHWAMMQTAIETGCKIYSFGHSTTGSSVHRYKQQWDSGDRIIYLNANKPVIALNPKINYFRKVIGLLPLSLMKHFDLFIARKYY